MPSTTKTEARKFARQNKNTAKQIREHMKGKDKNSPEYAQMEKEALDFEERAKSWSEYGNS